MPPEQLAAGDVPILWLCFHGGIRFNRSLLGGEYDRGPVQLCLVQVYVEIRAVVRHGDLFDGGLLACTFFCLLQLGYLVGACIKFLQESLLNVAEV